MYCITYYLLSITYELVLYLLHVGERGPGYLGWLAFRFVLKHSIVICITSRSK